MTKFEHVPNYTMEKAILKTLIYADIFDYSLKAYEVHKWLIGRKATLRQVESAMGRLSQKSHQRRGSTKAAKVKSQNGYYFLPKRAGLVEKRFRSEKQSLSYLRKVHLLTSVLKVIPWIKLVGISGGLAMENAQKSDDIDLFIITAKKRLWISRFLALGLLSLTGQRRKKGDRGRKIAGKLCINTLLEEDKLEQKSKDIYLAHEVLQMKVLWQRDGIYSKYLSENEWAFKFLPNWVGSIARGPASSKSHRASSIAVAPAARGPLIRGTEPSSASPLANLLENLAKWLQLKVMKKPKGMERIEDGALYFHPNDQRPQVLSEYKQRIKTISYILTS